MLSLLNGDEYPESATSTPSADIHLQVLLPQRTAEKSPWVVYQISGYTSDLLTVNILSALPGTNKTEPKIHACYLCALFRP